MWRWVAAAAHRRHLRSLPASTGKRPHPRTRRARPRQRRCPCPSPLRRPLPPRVWRARRCCPKWPGSGTAHCRCHACCCTPRALRSRARPRSLRQPGWRRCQAARARLGGCCLHPAAVRPRAAVGGPRWVCCSARLRIGVALVKCHSAQLHVEMGTGRCASGDCVLEHTLC